MKSGSIRQLWKLFYINAFISAFTFGGGYTVVPMIRKFFVEKEQLFTEEELMEMAAVAQSSPGAIAVNLSSLAGYRTAKTAGAIVSCVASVLPAFVILSVISFFYIAFRENHLIGAVLKGMEAGVAAMMADFLLDMCRMIVGERCLLLSALLVGAFVASFVFRVNVAGILLISCALCAARIYLKKMRGN